MGPISIFSLVILLSLATLSVLAVTTAQATFAATEKQASFTNDTYQNEKAAQEFVSEVDAILADARSAGTSRQRALTQIEKMLPESGSIEENSIHVVFSAESGRKLTIELQVSNNLNYTVSKWQATTTWNLDSGGDILWTP